MTRVRSSSSNELDALDRGLIEALEIDGRLPFSRIAAALGVSEQTIARRYRRLADSGTVRVVGLANTWRARDSLIVSIRTQPGSARTIGQALARRDDVSWVALAIGDSQVTCVLHAREHAHQALLEDRLPRVGRVIDVHSSVILRKFPSSAVASKPKAGALSADQRARLGPADMTPRAGDEVPLSQHDGLLLEELGRDGRASTRRLAAASGLSERQTARRIEALRRAGDLIIVAGGSENHRGRQTSALIWITVPPSHLIETAETLTDESEVTFTGAVSGASNLVIVVATVDHEALFDFISRRLGGVPGINQTDVIVNRILKRHGMVSEMATPATVSAPGA